jgi:hypothetical protein
MERSGAKAEKQSDPHDPSEGQFVLPLSRFEIVPRDLGEVDALAKSEEKHQKSKKQFVSVKRLFGTDSTHPSVL